VAPQSLPPHRPAATDNCAGQRRRPIGLGELDVSEVALDEDDVQADRQRGG
jgi:hypothetical protein